MKKYPLYAPAVVSSGIGLLVASTASVALAEPTSAPPASSITVKPVAPEPERRPPPARAPAAEPPEGKWYGWQTLLGMAGAHALFFTGIGVGDETGAGLMVAGAIGQFLAPPVVHFANGYGLKGLASIGLTLGIPAAVTGSFVLAGAADCSGGFLCGAGWLAAGSIFGGIAYIVTLSIDLSVIARHPVADRSPEQHASSFQLTLAPIPLLDGAALGLGGRF